jgi:carbonic anhydrase
MSEPLREKAMRRLRELFERNRRWAAEMNEKDPGFFEELSRHQNPNYLWIGCADSRVPANQVIDLMPGDVFVHRNIANVVTHTDINCLSVLQYAVEALKVKHVIVCGHYGCGGVKAAMGQSPLGLIDNWLRQIKDVYKVNAGKVNSLPDESSRIDLLCELNVINSVANVCHTSIVQDAWRRGETLMVHGWIYSLEDGLLRDLDCCVESADQIPEIYRYGET